MKPLQLDEIVMPVPTNPLAGKFAHLHDALRVELVELDAEIHGGELALITGSLILYLGEPGIAKSHLVNRMLMRITGMSYFHTLVDSYTGPDAVFGPLDLPTLRSTGAYMRRIANYLPAADVANIEEIFNAPDQILRAMHMIAYERKFNQDGVLKDVPLKAMFCSTNDLPKGGSTRAFFDRILQRFEVTAPMEKANIIHMLKFDPEEAPDAIMTWEDVVAAQAEVKLIHIPDEVYATLADIQRELDDENLGPSPRRLKMCTTLLRGEAWLDGADAVSLDHLPALVPAFWNSPSQIPDVEKVVLEHANPLERETLDLLKNINELGDMVEKGVAMKDADEQKGLGKEAYVKCGRAHKEYSTLVDKAGGSRRQLGLLQKCKDRLHAQSVRLLVDVFHVTDGSVKMPGES